MSGKESKKSYRGQVGVGWGPVRENSFGRGRKAYRAEKGTTQEGEKIYTRENKVGFENVEGLVSGVKEGRRRERVAMT